MAEPFRFIPRSTGEPWFFAGHVSDYANIAEPIAKLNKDLSCTPDIPASRVLRLSDGQILTPAESFKALAKDAQIIIFQYRGKFHAFDHECPHQSFPLSRGSLHDIEDFGIVLSAGIKCPKHGWAFDLFTGESDTGTYQLKLWETELRDGAESKEVWARKKVRRREG